VFSGLRLGPVRFLIGLLPVFALACSTPTGTISLAWDRVDQPHVTGYEIVYGPVGSPETDKKFVEQTERTTRTVEATIEGLKSCTEYHVEVKSVGTSDRESPLSIKITGWARPEVDAVSVTELHTGVQQRLTITGDNFDAGARLEFVDAGTTLEGFSAVRVEPECDCKQLVFDVTVAPDAPTGAFYIDIVNRDRAFGRSEQMVAVNQPSPYD